MEPKVQIKLFTNSLIMIDIETATHSELLDEYEQCEKDWAELSSDCFGFYISALHKEIVKHGGWPIRTDKRF